MFIVFTKLFLETVNQSLPTIIIEFSAGTLGKVGAGIGKFTGGLHVGVTAAFAGAAFAGAAFAGAAFAGAAFAGAAFAGTSSAGAGFAGAAFAGASPQMAGCWEWTVF